MTRCTSKAAYLELLNDGKYQTQAARIYRIVKPRANISLREIQRKYEQRYGERIDIGTVSARVCFLKGEKILDEEISPRRCSISHRVINPVFARQ